MENRRVISVALAGQPNVGKSTVFNLLTGLSQHVGNWPGKTVEKKEGIHVSGNIELKIVDLPGTYSLTAFSDEEKVARDYLIHDRPDVVVLIANGSALERGLYLLSEILLLGIPTILGINMIDVARDHGIAIDIGQLENTLKLPVVPMVAAKNRGIKELVAKIVQTDDAKLAYDVKTADVSEDHAAVFTRISELIVGYVPAPYTPQWVIIKLMEGDPEVAEMFRNLLPVRIWDEIQSLLVKHEDSLLAVVHGRYDWIENMTRASISRFKMGQILITDRLDHVLTEPLFGIPILLGVFGVIFFLTYGMGSPIQEWLEGIVSGFGAFVESVAVTWPAWIRGMVVQGVIGGAGTVLTFVPILFIFFVFMSFLEDVGYMARAAFVMDRFMHIVGLHGKSFLPICLGFGCNVPAILGSRIVDSKKARMLTIFLAPFVPCTARLAVLTFITAAFFGKNAFYVSWSLIAFNIFILAISGFIVSRFFVKGEPVPFVMELPLYHKPDIKTIGITVWWRVKAFIKKAGTVIVIFSVIIWFLFNYPAGNPEMSVLGYIGKVLEPLGRPIGLDWKMVVALLSSIVAKENSVATLSILYGTGENGLKTVLPQVVGADAGLAFLVIIMLFIPCAPTIAVMRQEMGNKIWFYSSLLFILIISYLGGLLAYNIAHIIGI